MSLDAFPSHLFNNEVLLARNGGVVTITINNPKAMNTFSRSVLSGIAQALEMCADDLTVMVVVLTGAGDRAFSAGGNLATGEASGRGMRAESGAEKPPPTVSGATRALRGSMTSSQLLRESHFVSIAAVNGACAGAGLSWACACDIRIAAKNALFRAGFLTAGLSGDFGGTWTLPRIVGPAKARELYMLNDKVSAAEAKTMGLVSKVVDARGDAFQAEVHKIANKIAASAPIALKRIKQNLVDADRMTFAEHLDLEASRHIACGFHPDAAEAGLAFILKRPPHFPQVLSREPWELSRL